MLHKLLLFRLSSLTRNPHFSKLNDFDIKYFSSFLPSSSLITDPSEIQPYNTCWRKALIGNSSLVLLPKSTADVSKILKHCNSRQLAVVPQGGNTGLVSGGVPVFDEIILSMKLMNQIERYEDESGVVTVQAGCILQNINKFLAQKNVEIPLDLGAKGSCQIGGNAATNAGGKYVIKYGSFRSNILGLEAVLPSGEVLDLKSTIQKDNTGYDLKHLFIGSEGTLGLITRLNINCKKVDRERCISVLKMDSYESVLKAIPQLRGMAGNKLNALEYMDSYTYAVTTKHLNVQLFSNYASTDHFIFVELSVSDPQEILSSVGYQDAIVSMSDGDFAKFWSVRESVATCASKEGKVLSYDVSFDVTKWQDLISDLRSEYKGLPVLGYGHIGDGNLHVNICLPESSDSSGDYHHDELILKKVLAHKGSISAEHGIGFHKACFLGLQKSPLTLSLYQGIKKLIDPKGIMNPYKVLPAESQ